ncbi:MAG: ferric reductase-like transmembrane domain-containing protein [Desulfobacterales bacterium]|jgi:predicted ferric reductase
MKAKPMDSSVVFTMRIRIALGGMCIFLVSLIIAGAWTIPFLFESPSILYKFGIEKTFLRSGKVLGITAAALVFFQVLLVSRLKFLDRIFFSNRMVFFHRMNGLAIAFLALVHPILIIAAENFTFFPFEKRYWPEFLGVGVLIFILVVVTTANWRLLFHFAYDQWLHFHRLMTVAAIALMTLHILFVSETFTSGFPHTLVFVAAGVNLMLISRLWFRRLFPGRKRRFVVSNVEPAGKDAYSIDVQPCDGQIFDHIPGQFAFITPVSENVPKEEHPFTISSTPSRPDTLQFVIRSLGDWTNKISRLKAGETMFIDGPYGLFSHMISSERDPIIMIAGGIGITPMLSMLRYMADVDDQRQILLIWSNKTKEHIVFPEEFKSLEQRLQHFHIIHLITRDNEGANQIGRLDQNRLETLLKGWRRTSNIFICGPLEMMKEMTRAVKNIGFSSARVYKEDFKL